MSTKSPPRSARNGWVRTSRPQTSAKRSPIAASVLLMSGRERSRSASESDWSALNRALSVSGRTLDERRPRSGGRSPRANVRPRTGSSHHRQTVARTPPPTTNRSNRPARCPNRSRAPSWSDPVPGGAGRELVSWPELRHITSDARARRRRAAARARPARSSSTLADSRRPFCRSRAAACSSASRADRSKVSATRR